MTTLAYDDLPPGSDIRREINAERVQITVPAGDPPRAVLAQAAINGFINGSLFSIPLLAFALVAFVVGVAVNRIGGMAVKWAWGFFAIFCAAVVLLVSWVCYNMIADGIRAGRRQNTVIAATPARLVIETAGPFGVASFDYSREKLLHLRVGIGKMPDDLGRARRVYRLELELVDGSSILLLPGRDLRELQWLRGMIAQRLNLHAA